MLHEYRDRLDGSWRHQDTADARNTCVTCLRAEHDRYRAALERIAAHPDAYPYPYDPNDLAQLAREALK